MATVNKTLAARTAPFVEFKELFEVANVKVGFFAKAVSLATATPDGWPSNRMVLMQHYDERGFVFYTNYESRKGCELLANPKAAMCFFWKECDQSVRIEGEIESVTLAEADAYWNSRPHGNKVAAWASKQSQVIPSREALESEFAKFCEMYPEPPKSAEAGKETSPPGAAPVVVPRPPHWSGFRLMPKYIEFWKEGAARLHHRKVYRRSSASPLTTNGETPDYWSVELLSP
jgi:pyridoxamine 5'-phosphate oxidase